MRIYFQCSTKSIVTVFSIVILVSFACFLFWIVSERTENYYLSQQTIAKHAVETVAGEIERNFSQKQNLVESFIEDNKSMIDSMVQSPDDEELFKKINNKLSRYFPDYFSFSLATPDGELLIDDFDGYIGDMCVSDMQTLLQSGQQSIRLHPNPKLYHYDFVVRFFSNQKQYVFLVSFSVKSIANILKLSRPAGHNLMLVQRGFNNLIEITPEGERIRIAGRLDFRMSRDEESRVLSETRVNSTRWHAVDIHNVGLLSQYEYKVKTNMIWVYVFVVLLILFFNILLFKQIYKTRIFSDSLLDKNKEVEVLNGVLKELNGKLAKKAITDSLTGIFNRRYFDEQIVREWRKAFRLGVPMNIAVIDIDFFKKYNDMYGHQMGDECIASVAKIIQDNFMRSNEFVARYGGEEFVVVNLGDKPVAFLTRLNTMLTDIAAQKIEHKGSDVKPYLSVSVGESSSINSDVSTYTELLALADNALYQAKEQGRDRVVSMSGDV